MTVQVLFAKDERGPDEALKLKFEALRQFNPQERVIAEGVLDSLIVQHQAKRSFSTPETTISAGEPTSRKRASR